MSTIETFVNEVYSNPEKAYSTVKEAFYGMTNRELKEAFASLAFAIYDMTDAETNEKIIRSWAASMADDFNIEIGL